MNSTSALLFSQSPTRLLPTGTRMKPAHQRWAINSSLTSLKLRRLSSEVSLWMLLCTLTLPRWLSLLTVHPLQSTGLPKATLVQLRIKVSAAHAGLSPPPELLSHPSQLPKELHQSLFLNNSSFHAHHSSETLVAVVAGTTGLGTSLRSTVRRRVLTTLTLLVLPLLMVPATIIPIGQLLPLPLMSKLVKPTRKSKVLSLLSQSQLPSVLCHLPSNYTLPVCSHKTVVLFLTTPSLLLVMETNLVRITSSLETHGVHHGVTKDISRSLLHQLIQLLVSAV